MSILKALTNELHEARYNAKYQCDVGYEYITIKINNYSISIRIDDRTVPTLIVTDRCDSEYIRLDLNDPLCLDKLLDNLEHQRNTIVMIDQLVAEAMDHKRSEAAAKLLARLPICL